MNLSAASSALKVSALIALASAAQLCAQVNYGEYNMILQNNLSLNGTTHTGMPILIGGNLDLSSSSGKNMAFGMNAAGGDTTPSFTIYGSIVAPVRTALTNPTSIVTASNRDYYLAGNYVDADKIVHANTSTSSAATVAKIENPTTHLTSDPLNGAFSTVYSNLQKASANFSAQTDSGTKSATAYQFTFGASSAAISYITLTSSSSEYLTWDSTTKTATFKAIEFDTTGLSADHKLVINIELEAGSTFIYDGKARNVTAADLLWNFTGVSTIILNQAATRAFMGSILATDANIIDKVDSTNIYGQIVAKSFDYTIAATATMEMHSDGSTFFTNDMIPTAPIPEPSTYALFGAASCGAFALLRRRRKAA